MRLYELHLIHRPVTEHGLSQYLVLRHKGVLPVPGIPGVIPVVPHDEVAAFRYGIRSEAAFHGFFCIHIVKRLFRTVDVDVSAADLYGFSGQSDDTFDKELAFIVRILEDDDVKPFRFAEYIGEAVGE